MSIESTRIDTLDYGRIVPGARVGASRAVVPPGAADAARRTAFEHALEQAGAPAAQVNPDEPVPLDEDDDPAVRLRFSRHAAGRIRSRGIEVSPEDLEVMSEALDRLEAHKSRESLLLVGDNAFVVGVARRTVITAMTRKEAVGSIFTHIDSTMVVR